MGLVASSVGIKTPQDIRNYAMVKEDSGGGGGGESVGLDDGGEPEVIDGNQNPETGGGGGGESPSNPEGADQGGEPQVLPTIPTEEGLIAPPVSGTTPGMDGVDKEGNPQDYSEMANQLFNHPDATPVPLEPTPISYNPVVGADYQSCLALGNLGESECAGKYPDQVPTEIPFVIPDLPASTDEYNSIRSRLPTQMPAATQIPKTELIPTVPVKIIVPTQADIPVIDDEGPESITSVKVNIPVVINIPIPAVSENPVDQIRVEPETPEEPDKTRENNYLAQIPPVPAPETPSANQPEVSEVAESPPKNTFQETKNKRLEEEDLKDNLVYVETQKKLEQQAADEAELKRIAYLNEKYKPPSTQNDGMYRPMVTVAIPQSAVNTDTVVRLPIPTSRPEIPAIYPRISPVSSKIVNEVSPTPYLSAVLNINTGLPPSGLGVGTVVNNTANYDTGDTMAAAQARDYWCRSSTANMEECRRIQEENDQALIITSIAAPIIIAGAVTAPVWVPPVAAAGSAIYAGAGGAYYVVYQSAVPVLEAGVKTYLVTKAISTTARVSDCIITGQECKSNPISASTGKTSNPLKVFTDFNKKQPSGMTGAMNPVGPIAGIMDIIPNITSTGEYFGDILNYYNPQSGGDLTKVILPQNQNTAYKPPQLPTVNGATLPIISNMRPEIDASNNSSTTTLIISPAPGAVY